jgi:hypothetical protein
MKLFPAHVFLTEIRMMETTIAARHGNWGEGGLAKARMAFKDLPQDCIDFGLNASRVSAERIVKLLSRDDGSFEKFRTLVVELQGRMIDEMSSARFFSMSDRDADYFSNPRKGWEEIISRFPDLIMDIEEAQKCFALSRYAAAVFHSLQVVELGIIELGQAIGVTDPHPGWAATANALQNILKKKYPERSEFEQRHWGFFEQIQATIEGLKNAWRNKVSHAHGKLALMTADFSPDVAEDILYATRAFMRRLATDGPLALQEPLS